MALLDEQTKQQVREILKNIKNPVELIYFYKEGDCRFCNDINMLLDEISSLSDKLMVTKYSFEKHKDKAEKHNVKDAPVIVLKGKNKGSIKFYGIPAGHEFGPFLMTLIDVSKGDTDDFPDDLKKKVSEIDFPVDIVVYVTPTCPYCPLSVRIAFILSTLNKNINAWVVEAMEFSDWANKHAVRGVPKTVINNKVHLEGAHPPDVVIKKILEIGGKA